MKKEISHFNPSQMKKSSTSRNIFRLVLLISCIFLLPTLGQITQAGANALQTTLVSPTQITPDGTPTPPTFDAQTPMLESSWGSPVYEVPLALTSQDHFYFSSPLSMAFDHKVNIDYRYGYLYPEEDVVHTGMDIIGTRGEPVLATAEGKVIFIGYGLLNGGNDNKDPYGQAVMIKHSFSFNGYSIYSIYAHLDKITVAKGDWVNSGDKIGTIGMTGNTSGPHLHFEVRIENSDGDKVQNPELWLAPVIGNGVLAGRVETTYGSLMTTKTLWLKSLATGKTSTILTYAPKTRQVDDFYQENFVVGDLPVGEYEVSTYYNWGLYKINFFVGPGGVTFLKFHGTDGFTVGISPDKSNLNFLVPVP